MATGVLGRLVDGRTLDRSEARGLMEAIMAGEVPPMVLAGILTSLHTRGETVDEITGFAEAMRAGAVKVPVAGAGHLDTCGTGGDGSGTFNISTATALLVAAMGAPVAKHGNRKVSSASGSADVLEELGVAIDLAPEQVAALVAEVGLGFMFAPVLHPALKHAMPVRRELGVRTVFNVLGPLANPAGAELQLLGVYSPHLCEPLARVLGQLGSRRAFVVHGADGLDEISPCGETTLARLWDGEVTVTTVTPEEAGVRRVAPADLAGGSAAENAAIIRRVLAGETGAPTEAVVLNAGHAAVLAGLADDAAGGVELARATLADGRGQALLESLAAASRAAADRKEGP